MNKVDYVFQPQLPFVSDNKGNIIVSHLGKLENMEGVQSYLNETLNIDVSIGFQNFTGKRVDYRKFFTPKLVDFVSEVYSDDISEFKYSFE